MERIKLLERTIQRLNSKLLFLNKKSRRLSWIRLTIVFISIFIGVLALYFSNDILSAIAVFIFLIAFTFAGILHSVLKKSIRNHRIWLSIKSDHLARARVDWPNIPEKNYLPDPKHPFAFDLDIAGSHSLHRLIDNTTTDDSSSLLFAWLTETNPEVETIKVRQNLIREMKPLHRFRDKLTLQSKIVSEAQFDGKRLLRWLERDAHSNLNVAVLAGISFIALLNISLFILNQTGILPPWYLITFSIYIIIFLSQSRLIGKIFMGAISLTDALRKCGNVLLFLEKYPFHTNSNILKLISGLRDKKFKPSKRIRRLLFILVLFGIRANIFLQILFNLILPVDFYLAYWFLAEKKKISKLLPDWLEIWRQTEAISAFANFAFVNPEYGFPEITDRSPDKPILTTRKLGHPLIGKTNKICNDFEIRDTGDIMLITGSNMSGKSTFLRTIGINLSLAYAGSVVNAEYFSAPLLRLFTCIKINDNLNEGLSYFYAEVKRLKLILDQLSILSPDPVFFLIDEIYKGTNNLERLAGSRAYIRSLAAGNGLGIVSTHDLELTSLENEQDTIRNFHFKEHIENGKMVFDYKIHSGPCPTTNALKIMEMEGLPVK